MPDQTTPRFTIVPRIVRLELPAPYTGGWVEARVNFTPATGVALASGGDETRTAFDSLIRAHNLNGEDGQPLPEPGNGAFFDSLPTDLAAIIINEVRAAFGKFLPRRA
jgi:hypothetical protein